MEIMQLEMMPVNREITRVDSAMEGFLISVGFKQYKDVLFAAHELLINSVQAMNQKYEESCPYVIKIEAKASPDIVEISITDYGGGLPEGWRESLEDLGFEDFFLLESGRGLMMINVLTDSFECGLSPDGAAIYKIIKRREENG
jgi:anti-sigma regulatory factor (Ser/Thr protein kinase)